MLIGFVSQHATSAELLVSLDATYAKDMLEGMGSAEGSGTPSGQLVMFWSILGLRMGPGKLFDEERRVNDMKIGSEQWEI